MFRFPAAAVAVLLVMATGAAAAAQDSTASIFEALRAADLRLATVGFRLASANAALCDRLEPGTGLQLQTADQYSATLRDAARGHFKMATPLGVEAVVAASPAERAGIRADDSIAAIAGVDLAKLTGKAGTTERLVATQLAIEALPPDQPIRFDLIRDGKPLSVTVQPVPACRSRFELRVADDMEASGDGTMVQVSSRFFETFPDDQIAAPVAHELAHNILHHRQRLEARHVAYGMLSGFGANVKYFRQTELEADILGVSLMTNAGYDPHQAVAFWRVFGPKYAGGILLARTHPWWRDRIATIEKQIEWIGSQPDRPLRPSVWASRNQPLDGNWRALLVRR